MGSLKASLAMVQPSPMFHAMSGVNPVLLRADSAEGQALRRRCLRGAVVVFFTAGACGCVWRRVRACSVMRGAAGVRTRASPAPHVETKRPGRRAR